MIDIFPDKKIDNPERLTLIVYLGTEYLSLAFYDPDERGSFFHQELTLDNQTDTLIFLKEVFSNKSFFSLPFGKVWIMYNNPVFTFVPDSIYEEKYGKDLLKFQFLNNQGIVLNNIISNTGIRVIYRMPDDIYQLILNTFAKPVFIHYSVSFISYFLEKVKNINNRRMVVNLCENGLDIFCFSGESLLLGNYFQCKDESEALYYILFTCKQLQFNQLNDYLHITGESIFKNKLIENLELYLKRIYLLDIPPAYHFEGIETSKIPFELAAISICGL